MRALRAIPELTLREIEGGCPERWVHDWRARGMVCLTRDILGAFRNIK